MNTTAVRRLPVRPAALAPLAPLALLLASTLVACASPQPLPPEPVGESVAYTFERYDEGPLPATFLVGVAGADRPGSWQIASVSAAPSGARVVAQVDALDASASRAPVAWIRRADFRDLSLRVVARTPEGSVSMGFGIAWHVRDANNYLACYVSGDTGEVVVDVVESGVPRTIGRAPVTLAIGRWYALAVEHAGGRFRCGIDGRVLVEGDDPSSFVGGSVGLLTRGSAVAHFDDFTVVGSDR